MNSSDTESLTAPVAAPAPAEKRREKIRASEPRNLLVLAFHHILLRVAWIFKTESVIMPAFLDTIAGQGWVRGCLPILSRTGTSIPPLMFSERLRSTRRKKWPLVGTTWLMAVPFLTLSGICLFLNEGELFWLPGGFLVLYALFFTFTGLNQLSFGTIQGKLIRPDRRGRLISLAGTIGSIPAILCAWFLMPRWLAMPEVGFGYVFGFTGLGFVAAGAMCLAVVEPADDNSSGRRGRKDYFVQAWNVFWHDGNFRRVAIVGILFITTQLLFPHYQALARQRLNTGSGDLMLWVVVQNAGAGLFSLGAGSIADRFGNRLAVRLSIFLGALAPPTALLVTGSAFAGEVNLFWLPYFLLGLTPVTMKTLVNYTLELADEDDHPRYVSTMKLCLAVPILLSPLVGLLIDVEWIGFDVTFLLITGLMVLGGLMTFRMAEPRYRIWEMEAEALDSEG